MAHDEEWHNQQIEKAFPRAWPYLFLGRAVLCFVVVPVIFWLCVR